MIFHIYSIYSGNIDPKIYVTTGLHVMKGGIVKHYNIPTAYTTTTVHYSKDWIGSITVEHENITKFDADDINSIETLCNNKISDNSDVIIHENLDRKDAEQQFGNDIYDKFIVPDHVKVINVLEIKNWNVNCSKMKQLSKTGELISLKIISKKSKFKKSKNALTVYFQVGDGKL